tara:strand:- start:155 stop:547 length:393 start_codon:yes stop_codon:yes gene_type:complete
MAISYIQDVIVMGDQNDLMELFPFWFERNIKGTRVHLSGSMDYARPMRFHNVSKKHPNLVFLETSFCDTDGMRKIYVIVNGRYQLLYDEMLENDLGGEFDFEFEPVPYKDTWKKFSRMSTEELKAQFKDE